ncbi:MAG TPA: DinB family protein [Gemmatimonadales bacterium]|nr:DinB family protein [Gemmatimonadales bacterium]
MVETERIADELDRIEHGQAWHGPAIQEALADLTAGQAAARAIPAAHSIWEIVLHMTAWANEVARRLAAGAHQLRGEEDWPRVGETDEASWSQAKAKLAEAHRRLRQAVREFPPGRVYEPVLAGDGLVRAESFYVMLHGLAQHDAYHTGQISLLKKALLGRAS